MADNKDRKARIAARAAERAALKAEMAGEEPETAAPPSVATDDGDSILARMRRRSADVDRAVEESVRGKNEDDK